MTFLETFLLILAANIIFHLLIFGLAALISHIQHNPTHSIWLSPSNYIRLITRTRSPNPFPPPIFIIPSPGFQN